MAVTTETAGTEGSDPREARFGELIHERIVARRWTSVARLVIEAVRVGLAPTDKSLLDWVYARIGSDALKQLIESGFARFNSPCCDSGFEKCDHCAGSGVVGAYGCLTCATLGRVRCPFCNGSSLLSYAEMPVAFREPAMEARVTLADAHLERLLAESLADISGESSAITELRLHAMNCDKLMGVFENALIHVHQHCSAERQARLAKHLGMVGTKARQRQLATFARLGECWNAVAATGGANAANAESRASTLQELCIAGSLRSSSYAHPFLFHEDADAVAVASIPQATPESGPAGAPEAG